MKGTELRSLTTGLWANSEVRFQLEDGTPLMLVMSDRRQDWMSAKDGRKNVKEGSPVPTQPPTLTLILRVQPQLPSVTETQITYEPPSENGHLTSAKNVVTEEREEKKTTNPSEYVPDIDEVPNGV